MQNIRTALTALFLMAGVMARGQDETAIKTYIDTYKDIAIAEMLRSGVPASITLAQGIHETMAGTSDLVLKSNNHFGIKCKNTWKGESVTHDDDLRGECFRKYNTPEESYRDHSDFLKSSPRYASLFTLDPLDYSAWAYGLKKAGYATNPKYPQIIIKLVQDYHLQDYSLIALGRLPANNEGVAQQTADSPDKRPASGPLAGKEEPAKPAVASNEPVQQQSVYPAGEFRINDTRVIFVTAGTSFLAIAQQYDIPLAKIFEFNDMKEKETAEKDQLIYLQRKRKTGNNEFHVVRERESLYDIAQTEAIRLESLLQYNQLESGMRPATGEQLYLKTKAPSRPYLAKSGH